MKHKTHKHHGLTTAERLAVWFGLLFINAIVTFVICLLLWRDNDPTKWSDFVGIFKWFIGVLVGLAMLGIVIAFALVAVNPEAQIEKARQRAGEATSSYELNIQK